MGLDVGVPRSEEATGPLASQVLDDIDELAASIVSPPRIPLGVLVGQYAALGLQDSLTDEILRGDHLQGGLLATGLAEDGLGHLGIHGPHMVEHGIPP